MSDKNIMKKVGQEEEEEKKTILSKDLVFDHIMRKTAEESNTLDSGIIFNSVELKQKVRSILKDTIETMTTDR